MTNCTCGGRSLCTVCTLAALELENDPFSRSVDAVLHAIDPKATVTPIRREPTDDEIYNRPGVEGGIAYPLQDDAPGSLGENDWRL